MLGKKPQVLNAHGSNPEASGTAGEVADVLEAGRQDDPAAGSRGRGDHDGVDGGRYAAHLGQTLEFRCRTGPAKSRGADERGSQAGRSPKVHNAHRRRRPRGAREQRLRPHVTADGGSPKVTGRRLADGGAGRGCTVRGGLSPPAPPPAGQPSERMSQSSPSTTRTA